jgi:ABC-type antimicrobial peptide transport system permease subunit
MGIFAGMALVLAASGIYAVMSYSVAQRTREIGIRMALGARPQVVLRLIVGNALRLVGIGLGAGLLLALALSRGMSSVLPGVIALDPLTFAGFALLLTAIALVASFIPSRRATKVDPLLALRCE